MSHKTRGDRSFALSTLSLVFENSFFFYTFLMFAYLPQHAKEFVKWYLISLYPPLLTFSSLQFIVSHPQDTLTSSPTTPASPSPSITTNQLSLERFLSPSLRANAGKFNTELCKILKVYSRRKLGLRVEGKRMSNQTEF